MKNLVCILLFVTLLIAACGGSPAPIPTAPPAPEPLQGGGIDLNNPSKLEPLTIMLLPGQEISVRYLIQIPPDLSHHVLEVKDEVWVKEDGSWQKRAENLPKKFPGSPGKKIVTNTNTRESAYLVILPREVEIQMFVTLTNPSQSPREIRYRPIIVQRGKSQTTADLKVNGRDSLPEGVPYDSPLEVTWSSTGATYCGQDGTFVALKNGGVWGGTLVAPQGEVQIHARHAQRGYQPLLELTIFCGNEDPGTVTFSDTVLIEVTPP